MIDVDILGHIFEQSITDLDLPRASFDSGGLCPVRPVLSSSTAKLLSPALPVLVSGFRTQGGGRGASPKPAKTTPRLLLDNPSALSQSRLMLGENQNQFSLVRAGLSTWKRARSKFLCVSKWSLSDP